MLQREAAERGALEREEPEREELEREEPEREEPERERPEREEPDLEKPWRVEMLVTAYCRRSWLVQVDWIQSFAAPAKLEQIVRACYLVQSGC